MRGLLTVVLTVVLAVLAGLAFAGPAEQGAVSAPAVQLPAPLPFDHAAHSKALGKAGLDCLSCHPVGLRTAPPGPAAAPTDAQGAPVTLSAPRASCHGCHLGELPGASRRAPRQCTTCHSSLGGLRPADHDQGWERVHADAARSRQASCADCHEGRWCVACHLDRGPLAQSPHGTGFTTTHGIEARLDPARCTTCHTGQSCTSCHRSGSVAW
jgi:hypothetical protein